MSFFKSANNSRSRLAPKQSSEYGYSLDYYIDSLGDAFQQTDGTIFSSLLSLTEDHADLLLDTSLCDNEEEGSPEPSELSRLEEIFTADYLQLVSHHLKVLFHLCKQNFEEAFNYQEEMSKVMASILPKLQNEDVSWTLPTINVIARDLSSLALKADQQQNRISISHEGQSSCINRAFNSIQGIVRTCAAEKGASDEHSKKRALVPLVNQLFRLCFRTGRANLCQPLVRTIENLKILDRCPASQVVTYHYFAGKLAVVEGDYVLAEQKLSIAYQRCSRNSFSNLRTILRLLVPLRLRMDIKPSRQLLNKYGLVQYHDIVSALQRADIGLFQRASAQYEQDFIRWRIFYLIDNLRLIMFRHVFRKLSKTLSHHIIPISDMAVALKQAGYRIPLRVTESEKDSQMPTDADAECIVVNLIGEELIKAYVSWTLKKIVVSKVDAFPSLKKSKIG